MEECSVLIETTKSAEDKTSRWFDLPIDYELFRDLLGVEADSKDYQITDMKLPFAGDIVRTTSVRRLNKLYFAYTDLSPEVQQAYKELIPYCGGVEDLLQESEEFLFYPECHNIMDVARYRLEHNIEFSALSEKGKKYFNLEAYAHELEEKGRNQRYCGTVQLQADHPENPLGCERQPSQRQECRSTEVNLALDNIKAQIIKHYQRISDRAKIGTVLNSF